MSKAVTFLLILAALLVVAAFSLVVFLSRPAPGEPDFMVYGSVADLATGLPIVGARVEDLNYGPPLRNGAETDSIGFYRYLTWAEEHSVVARASGYKPDTGLVTGEKTGPEELQGERVDFALERE